MSFSSLKKDHIYQKWETENENYLEISKPNGSKRSYRSWRNLFSSIPKRQSKRIKKQNQLNDCMKISLKIWMNLTF